MNKTNKKQIITESKAIESNSNILNNNGLENANINNDNNNNKYFKLIIFYSEISLKGKNKKEFENKLRNNIKIASKRSQVNLIKIEKKGAHFICIYDDDKEKINEVLSKIFGIKYFSYVEEIKKDPEIILNKSYEILDDYKKKGISEFNLIVKRADKKFLLDTNIINAKLKGYANKIGLELRFRNKDNTIHIKINMSEAYIYFEKIQGVDGLPTGSSGRTLVLLSGGIDSPVAAWMIMKRGATCDFLHFHAFNENKEVLNSKMINIINSLNNYQFKSTLYLIPHYIFDFESMGKVYPNYELILFKHYIIKMAEIIAKKYDYLAIVNGDSLAQVASQTLENIAVSSKNIDLQIFRPLIGFEKEEIINIAKKINTFDLSIEKYKDCCSLVAKNPITKAKFEKFEKATKNLNFEKLCEKSLEKMEIFKIISELKVNLK